MAKVVRPSGTFVRLSNGERVELRGYGALKDRDLKLMPGLDLTKPIYEQAIRKAPKAAAHKS